MKVEEVQEIKNDDSPEKPKPLSRYVFAVFITFIAVYNLFSLPWLTVKLAMMILCAIVWMGVLEKPESLFKKTAKKS